MVSDGGEVVVVVVAVVRVEEVLVEEEIGEVMVVMK